MSGIPEHVYREENFKWLVLGITIVAVMAIGAFTFATSQYVTREQALNTQTQASILAPDLTPIPLTFTCANYNQKISDQRAEIARFGIKLGCSQPGRWNECAVLRQLSEDLRNMAGLFLALCNSCPLPTPTTATPTPHINGPTSIPTPTPLSTYPTRTPTNYIDRPAPPVE